MMGIMAVCGLLLIALTACRPSMPGMRWSMKIASGRLLFRYSMACSAASAKSTSMSYFSSIRLKITRADFESSTTSARFRVIPIVYRSPYLRPIRPGLDVAYCGQARDAAFDAPPRTPGRAPDAVHNHRIRPSNLSRGFSALRFFVLRDPRQCGLHVGEFACGKPLYSDAGRLRLFLGEFGACDRVHPHQAPAYLSRELLLLFFGHFSSPQRLSGLKLKHDTRLGRP